MLLWLKIVRSSLSTLFKKRLFIDAAGLAFFSLMALAPFAFFMQWLADVAGRGPRDVILHQANSMMTVQARDIFNSLTTRTTLGIFQGPVSTFFGLLIAFFAAIIVFAHIHDVLNKIWQVAPRKQRKWPAFLKKQTVPLGMMLVVSTVLVTSFFVSTLFALLTQSIMIKWKLIEAATTFFVAVLMFVLLYKWAPDTEVRWQDAVMGALGAACLFEIGKYGLEKYWVFNPMVVFYGSSRSLVALLLWVYYSSLTIFWGAAIARACQTVREEEQRKNGIINK
ncbi:YihY/virulence factor BrkB family protein [bacterium]|nr:YihY/virulence factor BrkB family protein [bacterium]